MPNSISDAARQAENPAEAVKEKIRVRARAEGFDAVRFAAAQAAPQSAERLRQFLAEGHHGDMAWMAERSAWRADPQAMWPKARSIVLLGLNYGPAFNPLDILARRDRAAISSYAQGEDYHDVVKKKLKALAGFMATAFQADVKVFVDTAPVMEKPLAQRAGLGWQGKHTNLVSRAFGSWLFLGSVFTSLDLPPDAAEEDHCGTCHACLDICPTAAFPAPYRLDARRCISYLTIENKGPIPRALRTGIGNRIYGCDDCLAVCPWNKFAQAGAQMQLQAREDLRAPPLAMLATLDEAGFRALFRKSPVKRIGRARFLRNVLTAIGNSADPALAPAAEKLLADDSALVRGAAVWALAQLLPRKDFALLAQRHRGEADAMVKAEWANASEAYPDSPAPPPPVGRRSARHG